MCVRVRARACAFVPRPPLTTASAPLARGGRFCSTAKLFNTVLNFLRSQCTLLVVDKCNRAKLHSVYAEAEFYALVPLMEEVERQLAELDEEARKLEEERSRHKIHKAFAPRPAKPLVMLSAQSPAPCAPPPRAAAQAHMHAAARADDSFVCDSRDSPRNRMRNLRRLQPRTRSKAAKRTRQETKKIQTAQRARR